MKNQGMNKYRKPNAFLYFLFRLVSKIISIFFFNLKIERNELKKVKGPYVIIANHESIIDFICLANVNKNRHHFVLSNSFYNSINIKFIFDGIRAIPKQQFQTTPTDLKLMKRVVDNNMPLVLYPAGLMPDDGKATPTVKGTTKTLKWFGVDVYIAKISGSYFTRPKWAKNYRKSKITLNITKLFDKEEIKTLSESEINEKLEEKIYFDAYRNQENNLFASNKNKDIAGLENVLYICPKCNKEFTIIHQNKKLVCSCCNNTVYSDKYGFLFKEKDDDISYKYVSDWMSFISEKVFNELKENKDYSLTSKATLKMINYKKHRFEKVNDIEITLNYDNFILKGKDFYKEISIHETFILPFSPGKHFEIQDGKEIYRIELENPKHTRKWITVLNAFYKIRHL